MTRLQPRSLGLSVVSILTPSGPIYTDQEKHYDRLIICGNHEIKCKDHLTKITANNKAMFRRISSEPALESMWQGFMLFSLLLRLME